MRLNLGSHNVHLPGFLSVDIDPGGGPDIVCDLNKLPWPWAEVEEIHAFDIFEHLGGLTKVQIVSECARILKSGGKLTVRVPCGNRPNAWASLQHAHLFWFNSFEESYAQPWFTVERIQANFRNKIGVPYIPGTRFMIRLLSRWRLVHGIVFYLRRK